MHRSALALSATFATAVLLVGAPASQAIAGGTAQGKAVVVLDPGADHATATATATETAAVTPTVAPWPQWATVAPTSVTATDGHDHGDGGHGSGETSGSTDMSGHDMSGHDMSGHDMGEHMASPTDGTDGHSEHGEDAAGGHDEHAAAPGGASESEGHSDAEAEGGHDAGGHSDTEAEAGHDDGGHSDGGPAPERPRTTVLGSFAAVNAGVLLTAVWMRRRNRGEAHRKNGRDTSLNTTAPSVPTPAGPAAPEPPTA